MEDDAEIVRARVIKLLLLKKKTLLLKKKKLKLKIKRRWWVHPIWMKRKEEGYFHTLLKAMRTHDHEYFKNFSRMSPEIFDELVELLSHSLKKYPSSREPLSPSHRVAITLRYLATGESLISIAYGFRIGKSTAHYVVNETCAAMWDILQPLYMKVPTKVIWEKTAEEFDRQWQYPHCCGAVDGKHVVIQQPPNSGSMYYNYKGTNSVVLMAVVDAEYKFIAVDIGGYGSNSDGGIFGNSALGRALESGTIDFPEPARLPRSEIVAPFILIGDEAFALRSDFLRPYPGKGLTPKTRVFNYRLSRARRCSENAFGILAARWRVFHRTINLAPKNVDGIIKATVVLHNFLMSKEKQVKSSRRVYCPPGYSDFTDSLGDLHNGAWNEEPQGGLRNLAKTASRNYSMEARDCRNSYAEYFWEEGAVPWQWDLPGVSK